MAKRKQSAPRARGRTTRTGAKRKASSAAPNLPPRIFANASPHSLGGVSLFDVGDQVNAETVANFASEDALIERAVARLLEGGAEVHQVSDTLINFSATPQQFEAMFNATVVAEEREVIKGGAVHDTATFVECHNHELPGMVSMRSSRFDDVLEGVAIEEPRYYMAGESMFPPRRSYWHLGVPADVSVACNADRAHRGGITGKGIVVAMCDSGWYRHPFFTARGYRSDDAALGPGAANPAADESGHGTGESANIFAIAPDVHLKPVKMSFVNTTAAFQVAVGVNPHIITNSWGSSKQHGPLSAADIALGSAIASAVAAGIVVVFSAGNGHWGYPGQHPDVISAGGVFMDRDGSTRASDYASGFISNIYPNRRAPDLCGLVGLQPRAIYIMLPLEGGDQIDAGNAGGTHPNGDETATNDGWAAFSGTSAAAPQLAGAAALIKQACARLSPVEVRTLLRQTARDVVGGTCNPATGGHPAIAGPDTATGDGLVDAYAAVVRAKLRCMVITPPIGVRQPPAEAIRTIRTPPGPIRQPPPGIRTPGPIRMPPGPIRTPPPSVVPRQPGPIRQPVLQPQGAAPQATEAGNNASAPAEQQGGASALSAEEYQALSEMAKRGEITLDDLGSR